MFDLVEMPATTEKLGLIGPHSLSEVTSNALVSLAVPRPRLTQAAQHLRDYYGLELPDPEVVCTNQVNSQSIFWMARNQWMIECPDGSLHPQSEAFKDEHSVNLSDLAANCRRHVHRRPQRRR